MPISKKIAVYTAITGNYDELTEPSTVSPLVDYIAFVETEKPANIWKTVKIGTEYDHLDKIRKARSIKILGHPLLDKYDYTIWIDGNIDITGDIHTPLKLLTQHDLITFKHPIRNCIYDEAAACVNHKKESKENAEKLINILTSENYPKQNGLIESNVLIRKKSKNLDETMSAWWQMVHRYSARDQLSFNFVAHQNQLNFATMGDDNARGCSKYFQVINNHNPKSKIKRKLKAIYKQTENFIRRIFKRTTPLT